jgi:Tfp pilus tip-associated adhesin PilY1
MPRAVAESAHLLAAADYSYRPFVDAIPLVSEAQQVDGDGKLQWKTLLVSGMGGVRRVFLR